VERTRGAFDDKALVGDILPDDPRALFAAAAQLFPQRDDPGRLPFYRKARGLLERPGALRSADDYHLAAVVYEVLGEADKARSAYDAALARAPAKAEWRCELARLLRRQGRLAEARRQVTTVLAAQPGHAEARRLWDALANDMVE
ncbi:MAG TPA: tetratricopeptide repeat protein, partial [Gemmataceae bacterium]|nr:tetratricopeptide repeat protein [Gemmataceae bacterium]